jgi:hypothetical protein
VLSCNDLWQNQPGDYFDIAAGEHDISADPEFCSPVTRDFTLSSGSPCAAPHQPLCGQIGAYGVTCGPTAVEQTTWGS